MIGVCAAVPPVLLLSCGLPPFLSDLPSLNPHNVITTQPNHRPNAKANRGCGLVVMTSEEGAVAVIQALHRKFTWDGLSTPMVVERCCAARLGVKAATQHATRARRTALASAARRAVRTNPTWHGSTAASALLGGAYPLSALAQLQGGAQYLQGGAGGSSGPLAMLGGATAPMPPLMSLHNQAMADSHTRSAPLPLMRSASGMSNPPGLYGAAYSSSAYSGSPPESYYTLPSGSGGAGMALPMSNAAVNNAALQQAAAAAAVAAANHHQQQQQQGQEPLCAVSLQTPEQVSLVCDHAAALSALSGAAFWLQPQQPGAAGAGLALSGSPAQVSTAVELISQLLMRGPMTGAAAHQAVAAAQSVCWP